MIIYANVCSHCGSQTQIEENDNQFEIQFAINSLFSVVTKPSRFSTKYETLTFCDKECFIEYIKYNLEKNGKIKDKPNNE